MATLAPMASLSPLAASLLAAPFDPSTLAGLLQLLEADQVATTVYASDAFTRANSTTAPGSTDQAQAWTAGTGASWGISSNQLYSSAAVSALDTLTVNAGQADGVVVAEVTTPPTGNFFVGLAVRYVDQNNWTQVYLFKGPAGNQVAINQIVGGSGSSSVLTGAGLVNGATYKVAVALKGPAMAVFVNDVFKVGRTNASNQTATKHGVWVDSGFQPTLNRFDNFAVRYGGAVAAPVPSWNDRDTASAADDAAATDGTRVPQLVALSGRTVARGGTMTIAAAGELAAVDQIGYTLVGVVRAAAPAAEEVLYTLGGSANRVHQQRSGQLILQVPGTNFWASGLAVPSDGNLHVVAWRVSPDPATGAGMVTVWLDGAQSRRLYSQNTTQAFSGSAAGAFLHTYVSTGLLPFTGDSRRWMLYGQAHTDTDVRNLIAYYAALDGIAIADPARVIVFDGDSLTVGFGGFPGYTDRVLLALSGGSRAYNLGVGTRTIATQASDAATRVDPLLEPAIAKKLLVCWGGTNDLYFGATAATAHGNLSAYCAARKAAGWTVAVLTCLPRSGGATPGDFESKRQSFNGLIRANYATYADAIVDVGADSTIGDSGDELNATYYTADQTHLTSAGYQVVANLVAPVVAGL